MGQNSKIEIEAAESLLDEGVSLPFIRIPFTRKFIRLVMKRPTLGGQIRIARIYLQIGVTYEQMVEFGTHDQIAFMAKYGRQVSKMVALTICRGAISGLLFSGILAWMIRWLVEDRYIRGANLCFLRLLGTKNFMTIINAAQLTNPMRPRLSQNTNRKRS